MVLANIWGDRPAELTSAVLHHLVVGTPDPVAMADFYGRALGFQAGTVGGVAVVHARDRRLAFVAGPPKTLASAGFALPDAAALERLRQRIEAAGWPCENGPTAFLADAVSVRDPDGTRFDFGLPRPDPAGEDGAGDLNGLGSRVARLQHVVMASPAPEAIERFFVDVLGFSVADYVRDDAGAMRTCFLRSSREHHSFAIFKAARAWFDHHSYEIADWNAIRDWSDHFAAEYIRLQWGPGRHGPGNNLFVFIHDPDGNWIELSAELQQLAPDSPTGEWPHEERSLNSWGQGMLRS